MQSINMHEESAVNNTPGYRNRQREKGRELEKFKILSDIFPPFLDMVDTKCACLLFLAVRLQNLNSKFLPSIHPFKYHFAMLQEMVY